MRRVFVVIVLTGALVLGLATSALAMTPASEGMGKMYGEHISGEARAGTLGKQVHPGQHLGMSGWIMPMP